MVKSISAKLADMAEAAGFRPVIGLRAQGHIPAVIAGLHAGASWDAIGKASDAVRLWLSYDMENTVPKQEVRAAQIRAIIATQWREACTLFGAPYSTPPGAEVGSMDPHDVRWQDYTADHLADLPCAVDVVDGVVHDDDDGDDDDA